MSDYNVDTLENKIVVEAQEAINSLKNIIGYVNQSKTAIDSMKSATGLKALDSQVKTTTSNLTKMQLVGNGLKKALNVSGLIYGAKRAFSFLTDSAEKSIDYIETLNLFEVSMGKTLDQYGNLDSVSSKYYTKALKFQNELNEAFGTNIEETMRYQALYNQMAESMGINDNASYIISENLTKLGIDLASLFNKSESDTMEALRAGVLAGQTKPLRNYGLDVTQQTLAPLASELGIERSVKQLSQAEKMILRYIAVLRQASSAHGDFAKTIESPANQLKVFKQQFVELKTAIGNLFQGMLGQILPYVNGVLMVIKELIKAIGSLFGFKVSSSSTNLADQTGIEDLNTGLGGAIGSAKELKAQLMGFDEINNITTDTGSSGSGGGVSSTGIDSKLLDALSEYDNLMEKVKMKATDIRDKIMDWLGFTKVINPLTGEVSWKLREGWTNLKKIWTIIKGLIGLYLTTKVIKLIGNLTKLWNVLKGTKTATSAFGIGLTAIKNGLKGIKDWIGIGIYNFKSLRDAGYGVGESLKITSKGLFDLIPIAVKATTGIAGLAVSMYGAYDSMKDYSEGTSTASKAFTELGISIAGATASGALIGSVFGPAGTVIGGITGYLLGAKAASEGYTTELDKNYEAAKKAAKECENYTEAIRLQDETIQQTVTTQLAEVEYTKTLTDELMNLVDANGKVKSGYEARVSYILGELNTAYGTEYELIDGQIKQYDELKENIYKTINAKRAEILLEGNKAIYSEALKRDTELYLLKANAIQENENAISELKKELDEYNRINGTNIQLETLLNNEVDRANMKLNTRGDFYVGNMKKAIEYYETTLSTVEKYTNEVGKNNEKIIAYENLKTALIKEDEAEINKAMQSLTQSYAQETSNQVLTLKQQFEKQKEIKDQTLEYFKKNNLEISEDLKQRLESDKQLIINTLIEQTKNVKELSQEQIDAWKYLAENDKAKYEEGLNGLDEDTKKIVQSATGAIISETKNALPEVEKASSDINDVITKNMDGTFSINFGLNANYSELKNKLISMRNTISKMANVPIVGSAFTKYRDNIQSLINQLSVAGYAEGGFPDVGEIFMAREAGPELVGRIGRRTAVANNAQIVEAVSNGVYTAVSEAMNASNNNGSMRISGKLNGKELIQFTIDGINGVKQQTGECPIEVL